MDINNFQKRPIVQDAMYTDFLPFSPSFSGPLVFQHFSKSTRQYLLSNQF